MGSLPNLHQKLYFNFFNFEIHKQKVKFIKIHSFCFGPKFIQIYFPDFGPKFIQIQNYFFKILNFSKPWLFDPKLGQLKKKYVVVANRRSFAT